MLSWTRRDEAEDQIWSVVLEFDTCTSYVEFVKVFFGGQKQHFYFALSNKYDTVFLVKLDRGPASSRKWFKQL